MLKISCKIEVQVDERIGLWHNYTSAEIHIKTRFPKRIMEILIQRLHFWKPEFGEQSSADSVRSGSAVRADPSGRTVGQRYSKWALCIVGLTITRLATENQRLRDKLLDYELNNQRVKEDLEIKIEDLTADILTQEDELIVRDPRTACTIDCFRLVSGSRVKVMEDKLTEKDLKIKQLEDTISLLTRDLYSLAQSSAGPWLWEKFWL